MDADEDWRKIGKRFVYNYNRNSLRNSSGFEGPMREILGLSPVRSRIADGSDLGRIPISRARSGLLIIGCSENISIILLISCVGSSPEILADVKAIG